MRFISLKLNNITSLRGEHQIDFGEALGNEELFAITGATGAGKSSLLNAITLALFGKSYKNLNQWEFITQDEMEGHVDLEFSIGGLVYRALWKCKKYISKKGELKNTPNRQLLLDDKIVDTPIEDILGLNFEQFKKTIILNQGQFAEFLTATFTERKLILENLAGAELLSKLSKSLKEKVREMARVQGELEARIEGGLPFSDDELTEMRKTVAELEKKRPKLETSVERFKKDEQDLNELLKWVKDITRYKGEEQGALLELQSANDNLQKSKDENRQWQKDYDGFKKMRDQRRIDLQKAIKIEKELDTKIIHEKTLSERDQERKKSENTWLSNKDKWQKRIKEIDSIIDEQDFDPEYGQLTNITRNAIDALMAEWNETVNKSDINQTKIGHAKKTIESTKAKGVEIAEDIKKLESKKTAITQKVNLSESLEDIKKQVKQFEKSLPVLDESTRKKTDSKLKLKTLENDILNFSDQLKARKDKLKLSQLEYENLVLKRKQFELEHAIKLILDQGHDKDNCLVCGNNWKPDEIHKSFSSKSVDKSSELDKLKSIELEINSESVRIENLEQKIQDQNKDKAALSKEINSLENIIRTCCKELGIKEDQFSKDEQLKKKATLQSHIDAQEQAQSEIKYIDENLTKAEKERVKLRDEWSLQSKVLEECQEEQKKMTATIERSQKELLSRLPQLPKTYAQARDYLKLQEDLRNKRERLEQETKDLTQRIELGSTEAEQRNIEKTKDATLQTKLLQEIQHARQILEPLIPEGSTSKAIKQLEDKEDQWDKEKDVWHSKLKELEQKCETNRTKHGFISEQLKKARTELEKVLALINSRSDHPQGDQNSGLIIGFKKLEGLTQSEQVEQAINELKLWFDEYFAPAAKSVHEEFKALDREQIELKKSLEIDARKRKELDKFKEELDIAIKTKRRWDELANVLGQDEFRGFALGLVEERLVEQTNFELEHLCEGRYQITLFENKKQSQDFLVIDNWRGGGERKISTLSGGETFLVSLAMALSLAELTRGQTEVDAFFIDEGFGTLDRDSIDDVLDVLSNVQSRGKQIGLISHVKALTDRIPVNLHLEKSTLGDSKIRIVYN